MLSRVDGIYLRLFGLDGEDRVSCPPLLILNILYRLYLGTKLEGRYCQVNACMKFPVFP